MGDVELAAQLMAQLVGCEIHDTPQAGKASMGHAAAPHQLAHGLVVLAVCQCLFAELHHVLDELLCHPVSKVVALGVGHVALQGVHDNIGSATGNLIRRQGIGQLRIHDGKARAVQIRVGTTLLADFVIGQHS